MKRLLAAALAILSLCFLPAAADAEGGQKALCLGLSAFSGGGREALYFGEYEGAPVLCRVLSTLANDQKTPGLFVLSEYLLGKTMFDTKQSDSNIWMDSVARNSYCAAFYENAFTDAERDSILETTYTDEKYSSPRHDWGKCRQEGDLVFFLSVAEAENPGYGFDRADDATRLAYFPGGTEGQWWRLRSPSSDSYYDTSIIGPDGKIGRRSADHIRGARPAWNIDASAVLFASDAAGGAWTGETGALTPVPEIAPKAWKLTVYDAAHALFIAFVAEETVYTTGGSISIEYADAPVGAFVSAILADASGEARLCGRLVAVEREEQSAGALEIAMPALPEGDYTLYLFSETEQGAQRTNTGSRLVALPLAVQVEPTPPPLPSVAPETSAAPAVTNAPIAAQSNQTPVLLPVLIAAGVLIVAGFIVVLLFERRRR